MHMYFYIPPCTLGRRFKVDVATAVSFEVCVPFLEKQDNVI